LAESSAPLCGEDQVTPTATSEPPLVGTGIEGLDDIPRRAHALVGLVSSDQRRE
jgi:hypothetical protein